MWVGLALPGWGLCQASLLGVEMSLPSVSLCTAFLFCTSASTFPRDKDTSRTGRGPTRAASLSLNSLCTSLSTSGHILWDRVLERQCMNLRGTQFNPEHVSVRTSLPTEGRGCFQGEKRTSGCHGKQVMGTPLAGVDARSSSEAWCTPMRWCPCSCTPQPTPFPWHVCPHVCPLTSTLHRAGPASIHCCSFQ